MNTIERMFLITATLGAVGFLATLTWLAFSPV
jgi:hypothetical protein